MMVMSLAAVKPAGEDVIDAIEEALEAGFPVKIHRTGPVPIPPAAWDPARRQHNAPLVLKSVLEGIPPEVDKHLAIVDGDLYIPMLTFVYGQAQLGGKAGLVSLARLRQEFYALPENRQLLITRARKEALHETGHLFGLVHCEAEGCAMRLSTDIRQLDRKRDKLCGACEAMVRARYR